MRPCQKLSYERAPLRQLLEAAIAAYVNTTHSRYVINGVFHFKWYILSTN